jgi:hypothetical protein
MDLCQVSIGRQNFDSPKLKLGARLVINGSVLDVKAGGWETGRAPT